MSDEVDELLSLGVGAARAAGELLLSGRPADLTVTTKSTPTDVVTQMDTAAERLVATTIRAVRPDDAVLGEEGQGELSGGVTSGRRVRWIVDPIDGTVNYLYAIPQWAVSIAAEVDGVVEAGVVFDPSKDELFTATRGGGARLNGAPITASACADLSRALAGTGFAYDATVRARQAHIVAQVLPRARDIRRFGAASLDLCAVGCGRLDAYFERGLNLWDYAAAALIASEAGARVEGLRGAAASGEFLLAATPGVFVALHDLLAALVADAG
ncbi:MAG: inositol monophosphatase family protein [Trebonia sp.]